MNAGLKLGKSTIIDHLPSVDLLGYNSVRNIGDLNYVIFCRTVKGLILLLQ